MQCSLYAVFLYHRLSDVWRTVTFTYSWVRNTVHYLGSLNNIITKAYLSLWIANSYIYVGAYTLPLHLTISLMLFSLMNALLWWLLLGSVNHYLPEPEYKVDGKNNQLRKNNYFSVTRVTRCGISENEAFQTCSLDEKSSLSVAKPVLLVQLNTFSILPALCVFN